MRILVANEPRSYREVIGAALQALKPNVEVLTIGPEELDREVERSAPDLVLCSRLSPTVEDEVPAWVELYPNGDPLVAMSIDGLRMTAIDDIGLDNLLWIVDRAEVLAHKSHGRGS
jgi:CheY-like chemotaxis protein